MALYGPVWPRVALLEPCIWYLEPCIQGYLPDYHTRVTLYLGTRSQIDSSGHAVDAYRTSTWRAEGRVPGGPTYQALPRYLYIGPYGPIWP